MITVKKAKVLGDVRNQVIEALQPSWDKKGSYKLKPEDIQIFYNGDNGKARRITNDDDYPMQHLVQDFVVSPKNTTTEDGEEKKEEEKSRATPRFTAVEVFTTLPEDVFRTVKPEALGIITFIHPDLPQQWTSAAPLYCAAYKEAERSHPLYDVTTKGQIKASGVSLRIDLGLNC